MLPDNLSVVAEERQGYLEATPLLETYLCHSFRATNDSGVDRRVLQTTSVLLARAHGLKNHAL